MLWQWICSSRPSRHPFLLPLVKPFSLSLSLSSRREMGSIKRWRGNGAGSWLYFHRLYVGSSELVLRGAVSPDRWAPGQHQSLTRPTPNHPHPQVMQNCYCRLPLLPPCAAGHIHRFFLRRGQQDEKSADGADKGRWWCSYWNSAGITPLDGTFLTLSDITWVVFLFFFFFQRHTGWNVGRIQPSELEFMYICCSCVHRCTRALLEDVYLMLFSSHVFYYEWISCQSNVRLNWWICCWLINVDVFFIYLWKQNSLNSISTVWKDGQDRDKIV